jgi:hypothetical protein
MEYFDMLIEKMNIIKDEYSIDLVALEDLGGE